MSSLRQLGSGLLYAVVSVVLVVGGLSLALAEAGPGAPPPTSLPGITPLPPTLTATSTLIVPSLTATSNVVPATPQIILVTATPFSASPTAYVRPASTSTFRPYPTAVSCGPYYGWVRAYTVQPGDTLFHISTLYRTTVGAVQTANCLNTTMIFPGQRLWVPNLPTITPGITLIPTFPTSTPFPSDTPTSPVPPYYTETAVPSPTDTPNPDP
jgi:LysM domain-containing protein